MSLTVATTFENQLLFRDQYGVALNPDTGPTASLYIDGMLSATSVVVTSLGLPGQYRYSFTVPNDPDGIATLRVQATYTGQTAIDEYQLLGTIVSPGSPDVEFPGGVDATDRVVYVLQGGRIVSKGLGQSGQRPVLYLDEDEKVSISIDWSAWLGEDAIASVENETTYATVTNAANTSTTASMTINSRYRGYVEHRIVTANGQIKELKINVDVQQDRPRHDYTRAGVVY